MSKVCSALLSENLLDLNPVVIGMKTCVPGSTRRIHLHYTLIQYVLSGQATLHLGSITYDLQPGQAFLLPPNTTADFTIGPEAVTTRWVGFNGKRAASFAGLPPVFDVPSCVLDTLYLFEDETISHEALACTLCAELMLLCAKLPNSRKRSTDYVLQAAEYVETNYMHKISVENIALSLGLNRSYLTEQFRKKMGINIQRYILHTRLQAAKHLLANGKSVKEAATLSGFSDVSLFSKLFTRENGDSPKAWKQSYFATLSQTKKD